MARNVQIEYHTDLNFVASIIDDPDKYDRVVNIYAIPGAGKSSFMQAVYDQYQDRIPTCFMFNLLQYYDADTKVFDTAQFIADIVIKTRLALNLPQQANKHKYSQASFDAIKAQLHRLFEQFEDQNSEYGFLFLVDDYDVIPTEIRQIIDELVLSRIIRFPQRSVIILSSQQRLDFNNRLDVAGRLWPIELKGAREEDLFRSLPPDHKNLARSIRKWSNGMPRLVEYFIEKSQALNITTQEEFDRRENELIDTQYHERLRKVSFSREIKEAGKAQGKPDDNILIENTLDTLSLLRRFDIAILQELMPDVDPAFKDRSQKQYILFIRKLGSRVTWRSDTGGYQLDAMLRHMHFAYLQKFEPEFYRTINAKMIKICRNLLLRRYNQNHFVELLYHQIQIWQVDQIDDETIRAELENQLLSDSGDLRSFLPQDTDEREALWHTLQYDEDISKYVTEQVFKQLKG